MIEDQMMRGVHCKVQKKSGKEKRDVAQPPG